MAVACLIFPTASRADIGLPMIAVLLPPAWALLLPIILLEAAIGAWRWRMPIRSALAAQAVANAVSTLAGLPVVWIALVLLEFTCCGTARGLTTVWQRVYAVTAQAPWLIPYENDLRWMVPIASLVLCITFAAMSIALEYPIVRRMTPAELRPYVWRWVVWSNVASYTLLLAFVFVAGSEKLGLGRIWEVFRPLTEQLMEIPFRLLRGK
jgi:hypothetical protein